jgi:hypothetical protein
MAVFRPDAALKDPHARRRTYSGLVFSSEAGSWLRAPEKNSALQVSQLQLPYLSLSQDF